MVLAITSKLVAEPRNVCIGNYNSGRNSRDPAYTSYTKNYTIAKYQSIGASQ